VRLLNNKIDPGFRLLAMLTQISISLPSRRLLRPHAKCSCYAKWICVSFSIFHIFLPLSLFFHLSGRLEGTGPKTKAKRSSRQPFDAIASVRVNRVDGTRPPSRKKEIIINLDIYLTEELVEDDGTGRERLLALHLFSFLFCLLRKCLL
jgi:hypothetical protein